MGDIKKIFTKYPEAGRDNLIPILQDIQNEDGHLITGGSRNARAIVWLLHNGRHYQK